MCFPGARLGGFPRNLPTQGNRAWHTHLGGDLSSALALLFVISHMSSGQFYSCCKHGFSSVKCRWLFAAMMVHDGDKAMHRKLLRLCSWHLALLRIYYLCYAGRCHTATLSSLGCTVFHFNHSGALESGFWGVCLIVFFFFIMRQKINHRGKKWLHSCVGASWLQGIARAGEGKNRSWTFGQRSSCTFFFSFYNRLLNPCLWMTSFWHLRMYL